MSPDMVDVQKSPTPHHYDGVNQRLQHAKRVGTEIHYALYSVT
jgi:hypothetical protein